ncbi:MAG: hypothetical protein ACFFBU_03790, partial [Promethearchaeota archaeon]
CLALKNPHTHPCSVLVQRDMLYDHQFKYRISKVLKTVFIERSVVRRVKPDRIRNMKICPLE